jgi:hypothetical protein
MIRTATVVTLWDNNRIIHMLAREIPLLTKVQVIIYCHCSTRGFLYFEQDIGTGHRSQGRPTHCILISILNGFIHKNHLELWHRAISESESRMRVVDNFGIPKYFHHLKNTDALKGQKRARDGSNKQETL